MDNLTPDQRRRNMQSIRSQNTVPEKILFDELRRRKVYFAKHTREIVGKPDIVFRRKKVAVFVDSDFWHGHPSRGTMPASNTAYWEDKIDRNQKRDKRVNKKLRSDGWKVLRIWEYDIRHKLDKCMRRIMRALEERA